MFMANELSAVMGTSGSGKSTLLNALSGLTSDNVSGSIKVNGSKSNFKVIRNVSAYIMQDDYLYRLLSVRESMTFAIRFKTGRQLNSRQQKDKIHSILSDLGLLEVEETYVMNLSGGQQKRLSIAIELVSDPKVLFLDEPTTGLDSLSATKCLVMLKKLAREGKTIICTIHTPSALLFKMFDHLYVLAEGSCIYQGSSANVVPFLADLGLVCPSYYNPADYLLEISTHDYGLHNTKLADKIRNGANSEFRTNQKTKLQFDDDEFQGRSSKYSASFVYQLYLLISRNLIFMKRDKGLVKVRLTVVLTMAIIVGFMFYQIGDSASHVFDVYKFIYFTTHFLAYASYFSLIAKCEFFPVTRGRLFV
jgi:ABC-type multidrug transport system ATPase subunit